MSNHFKVEKLEKYLKQKHREFSQKAQDEAKRVAVINKPHKEGDSLVFYVSNTQSRYQGLLAYIDKTLQLGANAARSITPETLNAHLKKLDKKLEVLNEKIKALRVELERIVLSYNFKRLPLIITGLIGLWLGDVAFNAVAFQVLGDNLISTTLLAVATGITLAVIAHRLPWLVRRFNTRTARIVVAVACAIAVTVFLYIIGDYRVDALQLSGNDVGGSASPISFAIINLFFLGATMLLFQTMPNQQQYQDRKRHKELSNELNKYESEDEQLKKERKQVIAQTNSETHLYNHMAGYSKSLKREVDSMYKEAVALYMTENITRRDDKCVPTAFNQQPPPLDLS